MFQIRRKIIESCGLYFVLKGEAAGKWVTVRGKFVSLHEETLTMKQTLIIWWVWVIEPFIRHPIATIKDAFRPNDAISIEDLNALTPEEREALK